MKPAAFDYLRPADLSDAVKALAGAGGAGRLIAGGQSLGPMLNLRLARPGLLIDIGQLPELRTLEDHGTSWCIGAATTHAEIEDSGEAFGCDGMLSYVARRIAYRAVRNRGTIGGSLAHADPAADWPLVLAALGASVELRGPRGTRRHSAADLMVSTFTTVLNEDELIAVIEVPKLSAAARWGTFKLCRKAGEFPIASAAVVLDPERAAARVYLGALAGPPRALPELAETLLRGGHGAVTAASVAEAVRAAVPSADAVECRLRTACLVRAIEQAFG